MLFVKANIRFRNLEKTGGSYMDFNDKTCTENTPKIRSVVRFTSSVKPIVLTEIL